MKVCVFSVFIVIVCRCCMSYSFTTVFQLKITFSLCFIDIYRSSGAVNVWQGLPWGSAVITGIQQLFLDCQDHNNRIIPKILETKDLVISSLFVCAAVCFFLLVDEYFHIQSLWFYKLLPGHTELWKRKINFIKQAEKYNECSWFHKGQNGLVSMKIMWVIHYDF